MVESLNKRQEKILNALIDEYVKTAEPVSSKTLAKKRGFNVSPATVRNELQKLTDMGYICQPHTSAGRMPTVVAYRYFVDNVFESKDNLFFQFFTEEIEKAKEQIENEMKLAENLMESLGEISSVLNFSCLSNKDNFFEVLTKLGPSKTICDKNTNIIKSIIKELENF